MSRLAFYAPMKSPRHPVPSGDRELAAGVLAALQTNTLGLDADLVSELRCYDGKGDALQQQQCLSLAEAEIARLLADPRSREWKVWVTYHNYYKAPDLLGPALCQALDIPYVLIEASRSRRRLDGAWAGFASRAEAACDQAVVIFYLTERDREALQQHRCDGQQIVHLPPFLNLPELPALDPRIVSAAADNKLLLAVGMHRHGDKVASYQRLASILPGLETSGWRMQIVGDGPARAQVEALFSRFADRTEFLGKLHATALAEAYANATVFTWPGVNEAFGMVYLEAQAAGLPVLAEDRPGVREVVASQRSLIPAGDVQAFAEAIDSVLASRSLRADLSRQARKFVHDQHLSGSAANLLSRRLGELLQI